MAIEFRGHHGSAEIPPPAPPHVPGVHDPNQFASSALLALCAAAVAAMPGALLGAGLAWLWWRLTRASELWRWTLALLGAAMPGILHGDILWAWPWRWLVGSTQIPHVGHFPPAFSFSPTAMQMSLAVEATAGPLLLQAFTVAAWLQSRSLAGHMARRHRREVTRDHALSRDVRRGLRGISSLIGADANRPASAPGPDAFSIRLGVNVESTQPFDLAIAELRQHVFVPGASGSGKSTTLMRLADGCMKAGWTVVIVDCKGTGLLPGARMLATQHKCELLLVNPNDGPRTYGYNPCIGDGPEIANKLVGAFSFGADAEIYKNISSYVLSVTVDAMHRSGEEVNLGTLIEALGKGGLSDLASKLPQEDPVRRDLIRLDTAPTELERNGVAGMLARLRALATGRFGPVFRAEPYVNWDRDTAHQSVLYFALPTTGAPEDVALMGRVLAQDIKQLCDRRLQAVNDTGAEPLPILLIFDEFAQLGEAQQIVDLLLQARQAHISLVLATQLLPKEEAIRKPAIQSGVLIIHRVEAEDAEKLAAELGTRRVPEHTWAPGMSPEETDRLSVRMVDEYTIHPNVLRRLTKPGRVAVRAVLTDRDAIVQVSKPFEA